MYILVYTLVHIYIYVQGEDRIIIGKFSKNHCEHTVCRILLTSNVEPFYMYYGPKQSQKAVIDIQILCCCYWAPYSFLFLRDDDDKKSRNSTSSSTHHNKTPTFLYNKGVH